jgi:hypothetical protein
MPRLSLRATTRIVNDWLDLMRAKRLSAHDRARLAGVFYVRVIQGVPKVERPDAVLNMLTALGGVFPDEMEAAVQYMVKVAVEAVGSGETRH